MKYGGKKIKRLQGSPSSLASGIDQREKELKVQPHEEGGSMFIGRYAQFQSTSLFSWDSSNRKSLMRRDTYLVTPDSRVAYEYTGKVSPDKQQSSLNFIEILARNIRSRTPSEIPTDPGFCIDGGFIAGNTFQSESVRAGVQMPEHPGMQISFWSSTGTTETTLLERADGFLQGIAKSIAGLHTLRKGKRNIGPIRAEEYLIAASANGERSYGFKWESQGKDDSLASPTLSLELNVLERGEGDDGNPPPPAFESDEEALELWDAILDSIRLRPGAA